MKFLSYLFLTIFCLTFLGSFLFVVNDFIQFGDDEELRRRFYDHGFGRNFAIVAGINAVISFITFLLYCHFRGKVTNKNKPQKF